MYAHLANTEAAAVIVETVESSKEHPVEIAVEIAVVNAVVNKDKIPAAVVADVLKPRTWHIRTKNRNKSERFVLRTRTS